MHIGGHAKGSTLAAGEGIQMGEKKRGRGKRQTASMRGSGNENAGSMSQTLQLVVFYALGPPVSHYVRPDVMGIAVGATHMTVFFLSQSLWSQSPL